MHRLSLRDIRRIPKSSITGRAMERADAKKLKRLIAGAVRAAGETADD